MGSLESKHADFLNALMNNAAVSLQEEGYSDLNGKQT